MGRLHLVVQLGVPILTARHEDAVDGLQRGDGLVVIGDLGHEDRDGAVALKCLGKADIVVLNLVALPGDANNGSVGDAYHVDGDDLAVLVELDIGMYALAQRALARIGGQHSGRYIGRAHDLEQGVEVGNSTSRGVAHSDIVCQGVGIHDVIVQPVLVIDLVQDRILNQRARLAIGIYQGLFVLLLIGCKDRASPNARKRGTQRNTAQTLNELRPRQQHGGTSLNRLSASEATASCWPRRKASLAWWLT